MANNKKKMDLIDRYIYQVVCTLPQKQRADIEKELHTLIDDMLEARCGENEPTDKDIRVVLTELGTPQELSDNYAQDKHKALLSAPYYRPYTQVMRIVLTAVSIGLSIAAILNLVTDQPQSLFLGVLEAVSTVFTGLLCAFAFVTLLFVIFERKNVNVQSAFTDLDELPPVPKEKARVSRGDAIAEIVITLVFLSIFLIVPQIFSLIVTADGVNVPAFDLSVLLSRAWILIGMAACSVVHNAFEIAEGVYSRKLMMVTLLCDAINIVLAILLLADGAVFNPAFMDAVEIYCANSDFMLGLCRNLQLVLLAVAVLSSIMDAATTTYRTLTYGEMEKGK